jgi:hypothetical protein
MTNAAEEAIGGIAMIKGISHITLIVKDLEKTAAFLKAIFDARKVYSSGENMTLTITFLNCIPAPWKTA